jgi:prevent-host-death family protein
MTMRNVTETKAELSALLVMVENGEDVIISRAGKPVARIVKIENLVAPRQLGLMRGKGWISPDFDDPDPELENLFYEGSIEPAR